MCENTEYFLAVELSAHRRTLLMGPIKHLVVVVNMAWILLRKILLGWVYVLNWHVWYPMKYRNQTIVFW